MPRQPRRSSATRRSRHAALPSPRDHADRPRQRRPREQLLRLEEPLVRHNWIVTSPTYQDTAPTYPAFGPAAKSWLKKHEGSYYASPLGPAFKAAANTVYPAYGYVKFYESGIWSSAVVPAITKGETIASVMGNFDNQLVQQAKINGYQVVRS